MADDQILIDVEWACDLFLAYKWLLTDKQKEIFEKRYFYDLSIGELAEIEGVSRAAIHDSLKKSLEKLEEAEKGSGMASMRKSLRNDIESLKLDELDEENKKIIEHIKELLKWPLNH
ncbi:MAG: hypothetical protein K5694_03135 [Bacilli bacterium]|nr:hypothetical protein [Bacilli bacterium]